MYRTEVDNDYVSNVCNAEDGVGLGWGWGGGVGVSDVFRCTEQRWIMTLRLRKWERPSQRQR